MRSPLGLEAALAEVRGAILAARDPEGALERLRRHVRRERQFAASPAALVDDELVAARTSGIRLQEFSTQRRS